MSDIHVKAVIDQRFGSTPSLLIDGVEYASKVKDYPIVRYSGDHGNGAELTVTFMVDDLTVLTGTDESVVHFHESGRLACRVGRRERRPAEGAAKQAVEEYKWRKGGKVK